MRSLLPRAFVLAALLASACETPPAFFVPPGPPRQVVVDVMLPVFVPGEWTAAAFTDALRVELAKYRVEIAGPAVPPPGPEIRVDLGEVTYRQWESIDVSEVVRGVAIPLGAVRVPDLSTSTVEAAAAPAAAIIARRIWGEPARR